MKKWYTWDIDEDYALKHVRALLDMLRYDSAIPCSNAPSGTITLRNEHGPTVERWSSFGFVVKRLRRE